MSCSRIFLVAPLQPLMQPCWVLRHFFREPGLDPSRPSLGEAEPDRACRFFLLMRSSPWLPHGRAFLSLSLCGTGSFGGKHCPAPDGSRPQGDRKMGTRRPHDISGIFCEPGSQRAQEHWAHSMLCSGPVAPCKPPCHAFGRELHAGSVTRALFWAGDAQSAGRCPTVTDTTEWSGRFFRPSHSFCPDLCGRNCRSLRRVRGWSSGSRRRKQPCRARTASGSGAACLRAQSRTSACPGCGQRDGRGPARPW